MAQTSASGVFQTNDIMNESMTTCGVRSPYAAYYEDLNTYSNLLAQDDEVVEKNRFVAGLEPLNVPAIISRIQKKRKCPPPGISFNSRMQCGYLSVRSSTGYWEKEALTELADSMFRYSPYIIAYQSKKPSSDYVFVTIFYWRSCDYGDLCSTRFQIENVIDEGKNQEVSIRFMPCAMFSLTMFLKKVKEYSVSCEVRNNKKLDDFDSTQHLKEVMSFLGLSKKTKKPKKQ